MCRLATDGSGGAGWAPAVAAGGCCLGLASQASLLLFPNPTYCPSAFRFDIHIHVWFFFWGGGWFQGTVYVLALGAPSRPTTVHSPPVPQTQHLSVASAVSDHQEDGAGEDEGRALRQAAPQIQPHCPSQELWVSLQGSLWEAWMGISRPQATSRTLNLELDSYRALAFSLQTVPSRSLVDGAMGSSSSATPWAVPGAGEKPEGRLGRGALEGS